MTIGFKNDQRETIIEAPLGKECEFLLVNTQMLEDGESIFVRSFFEIVNGKKIRQVLNQKFLIHKFHPDPIIKPRFVPVG